MIVAVTGHRPDKLGGYRIPNTTYNSVMQGLDLALLEFRPSLVLTGMALGVDQWMAELCIWNGIPFVAVIPFNGFESRWPTHAQAKFRDLLSKAENVTVVCAGEYAPWKMHRRNEWLVNNSERLIAVFDGSGGGTANCVSYAQSANKPIHRVQYTPPPRVESREIARRVELRPASEVLRNVSIGERRIAAPESDGRRAARREAIAVLQNEQIVVSPTTQREINNLLDELLNDVVHEENNIQPPTNNSPVKRNETEVVREFSRVVDLD